MSRQKQLLCMADADKGAARAAKRHAQRAPSRFELKDSGDTADLILYGEVGGWFGGIEANDVVRQIAGLKNAKTINIDMNSLGGDVFDGFAIYNALKNHAAKKVFHIGGVAASIATVMAMAGDEINMASNAMWMVHDPHAGVLGSSKDMREMADLLDKARGNILDTYVARTGGDRQAISDFMAAETWMTADEAKANGFVTNVIEAKQVAARGDKRTFKNFTARLQRLAASATRGKESLPPDAGKLPASQGEFVMNEKLRALCVKAGMDEKLTDEQAQAWLVDNGPKVFVAAQAAGIVTDVPVEKQVAATTVAATAAPGMTAAEIVALLDKRETTRIENRKKLHAETLALVDLAFGEVVPVGLLDSCAALETIEDIRGKIKEVRDAASKGTTVSGAHIRFADHQPRDAHREDLGTALLMRAFGSNPKQAEKHVPQASKKDGWKTFQNCSLLETARECLIADGYNPRGLSGPQLAQAACGFFANTGLRAQAGDFAYHTTGSLAYITLDAMNKSLLAGYEEAPQTWKGPMRQAASVSDFKNINRVKLGAIQNLPVWNDNSNPEIAAVANEKETYAVEARSLEINFSWRLVVNDDMDALSRIPQLLGDAAGRTVNAVAWAQITGNPTLSDGQALFLATATGNRKRSNLTTGSATPSVTTLGTMKKKMRQMRGLNTPEGNESQDILNLSPTFIVVPSALETLTEQLINSAADPASSGNAGIFNTTRYLTQITEPLLDADSATAWYLFASPNRVDTVEVSFLQGQESPVVMPFVEERTMSQNFIVLQTFAAKAIEHRGVQRHDGV